MKRAFAILVALLGLAWGVTGVAQVLSGAGAVNDASDNPSDGSSVRPETAPAAVARFGHVDVFVDSPAGPLAAYQCDITATTGDVTLVGIEGGEHVAFKEPPYYDPKALGQGRIILGAFNTGADLPRGRTRVARLMVRVVGPTRPAYAATLQAAASPDARPTPATISVSDSESQGAE